jgi:hypothetical protein
MILTNTAVASVAKKKNMIGMVLVVGVAAKYVFHLRQKKTFANMTGLI